MITLISPDNFKTIPWKNGLGFTTELAINDGATLDDFDWRLSIASVANDGEFSNFSGYERNLVLIEGNGITLEHYEHHTDKLTQLLDIAKFDGAYKTTGLLHNGAIKDFNVITKQNSTSVEVNSYTTMQQVAVPLQKSCVIFAYSLTDTTTIESLASQVILEQGSLAKVTATEQEGMVTISGKNLIITTITLKQ
ncbi:HutD family protein [Colwellia sp. D2M02]|uniref:HutD family protein n=1 Tax=Colwellia asteriadis TaxID=517723 RepID=A0ABP3WGJ3_9GAMM|nr:HutD family protein [Colwellia sp. D2M02]MBU2891994.1 HutD family protein [Colwellia sp. D2M02]